MLHPPHLASRHFLRDTVIAADRRRAMTMAPLFSELLGGHVAAEERRYDGPVPASIRAQAEERDAAASAARQADPTLSLSLRIVAAEAVRNTNLAQLGELDGWLAERTDIDDAEHVVREHSSGSSSARMYQHRDEAAELRSRVVADLRLLARLNAELAALVERRDAA